MALAQETPAPRASKALKAPLQGIDRSPAGLRANLLAGLIVGVVALPLSIALAVAVGASPVTGLYTAAAAGAIAAACGGSSYNITGPTAALVPVLSHAVLRYGAGILPTLAILSGFALLALSAMRAGRLIRYVPGPVVVGFTAGIALSIAFGQVNGLLGVTGIDPAAERFHERFIDSVRHADTVRIQTPAVAAMAVAILIVWPRVPRARLVPGPLVAVVAATALVWLTGLDTETIGSRYGSLPGGLPMPSLGPLADERIFELLPLAASIAVLAGIESLLSAVVADGMAGSTASHDPSRELRGQGLGSIAAGLVGGMPSTAAIARTAAGISNGASNRLTGITHAITVLAATVVFGGLVSHVPLAALSAILVIVAWNIAELPQVARLIRRAPRADAAVLIGTALITLSLDLTYAIAFGIIASTVLLLRQMVRLPVIQELLPDPAGRVREVSPELAVLMASRPDLSFFAAEGSLSFHSAATFEYELATNLDRPLILRMRDVSHIDTSGLLTLRGVIEHRQRHGGRIVITAARPAVLAAFDRFGITELLGSGNLFEHTRCAIESIPPPNEA